jgi:radical SAM superfamily enzyme YgiQ (UPF0313 family)
LSGGLLLPQTFVSRVITDALTKRKRKARELKKTVEDLIQKHYPEHLFAVEVMEETGSILIDHLLLAHAGARYFCRFEDYERSGGQAVVKLAGEILERVNIKRGELKHYEEYDGAADELAKTQFSAR